MKKFIFHLSFSSLLVCSAYAQDFNGMANQRAQVSWLNARTWAHFLVVSDLLGALSDSLAQIQDRTISAGFEFDKQMEVWSDEFGKIAQGEEPADSVHLRELADTYLTAYRGLIRNRSDFSKVLLAKKYDGQFLIPYLQATLKRFQEQCRTGRSSPLADVEVPSIELPSLGVSVTVSPSLETYIYPSIHFSSGAQSDWERDKGVIAMGAGTWVAVVSESNPYAAAAFVVIFAIVDRFVSASELDHMEANFADAELMFYNTRAHGSDVSKLYSNYCSQVGSGLSKFVDLLSASGAKLADDIEYSKSSKFLGEFSKWVETQSKANDASCRASLLDNLKLQRCPSFSTPDKPLRMVDEPICQRSSASGTSCPKIKVGDENYCRVSEDGSKIVNKILIPERAQNGKISTHFRCEIPKQGYDCSKDHIADLRLSGREREAKWCEDIPVRAAEAKKIEEQRKIDMAKAMKECMDSKPDPNNKNTNQVPTGDVEKKRYCEMTVEKKFSQEVTEAQLRAQHEAELKAQEEDRKHQREILAQKVTEASRILGYYTLYRLSDSERLQALLQKKEEALNAAQAAAERRLVRLLTIINSGSNIALPKDQSGYTEFLVLERDFVRLCARAIQNIMRKKPNQNVIVGLQALYQRYNAYFVVYPTTQVSELGRSILDLVKLLGSP